MTRRYVRDNRGRFSTTGATARGAGLKTASGNKRASVQITAAASKPASSIKGKVQRDPGAAAKIGKAKPAAKPLPADRPRIRANGRPVGVVAKYTPQQSHGFRDTPGMVVGSPERKAGAMANAKRTRDLMVAGKPPFKGVKAIADKQQDFAAAFETQGRLPGGSYVINASSPFYANPLRTSREARKTGFLGTSDPRHVAFHEVGHAKHQQASRGRITKAERKPAPAVAGRVSKYATTNQAEFVAEVHAGLRVGRLYDHQVMKEYKAALGTTKKPAVKRRKP